MFGINRILVPRLCQERIQLHHSHAYKMVSVLGTSLQFRNREVPGDVSYYVAVYTGLSNDMHGDKKSHNPDDEEVLGTCFLREIFAADWAIVDDEDIEDV